jgi:hypothetical protein
MGEFTADLQAGVRKPMPVVEMKIPSALPFSATLVSPAII